MVATKEHIVKVVNPVGMLCGVADVLFVFPYEINGIKKHLSLQMLVSVPFTL